MVPCRNPRAAVQPSGNQPLLFALGNSALRTARTAPARYRVDVRHDDGIRWSAYGRRIARAARRHLLEQGMSSEDVRARRIHEDA
jgi:hypothetical protein